MPSALELSPFDANADQQPSWTGYTIMIMEERDDMLDELQEIPLKGFPEIAASYLFQGTDGIITVPGAPLMKDYDSFTEGTAKGSFYSIPAASTDEYGDLIHPINALTLAALPLHDIVLSLEQWRQDVDDHLGAVEYTSVPDSHGSTTPTNAKRPRPRSSASSDKGESRNCRARAESPPTPLPPPRARAKSFSSASLSIMNSFIWSSHFTRPPPLKLTHAHPRAPASAPPD
ncbi:hypothetical protein B0H10DRAFT_2007373 [Mycena sp. CBHHK59/15]|nr:hypothetical protein B0H10DRAFT_2007373 [Mycena sp. CBHHK59/15]